MVSKIQTSNNGLSQPHFQGFFSPQLFLKRPKIRHFWSLFISSQVNQYSIWKIYSVKSPADNVSLGPFLCHSSSLDKETEVAYDNYKSYEHIMVSRDDYRQKNVDLLRTEHTHYY